MQGLKRFKKILLWIFISLIALLLCAYIFIRTPFGQNWIIGKITNKLSKELQTKIKIGQVDFSLFDRMYLEQVLINDRKGDTILYAGNVNVKITDWFFFKDNIDLKYVGLNDAVIKFQRDDSVWRQQFIFDYFSSPSSGSSSGGIQLNLKKADLSNITFLQRDGWVGQDMSVHVGKLELNANNLNLTKNHFDIQFLKIKDPVFTQYSYKGLRPKKIAESISKENSPITDTSTKKQTDFALFINSLKIINGTCKVDQQTDRPAFNYFDGMHVLFSGINADFSNTKLSGDSIISHLLLSGKERSGFEVKQMTANVILTKNAMAFANLDLQTNNSRIRDFFMMSYKDLADMNSFIHKVKMIANFKGTNIDSDDIGFFAPELKTWKKEIVLSGKVRGSVDEMFGRDLIVQAGSNTLLDGDITLTGLPDIEETFIDFKANQFRTNFQDATTVVPALRKVKTPNLAAIRYLEFSGSFTGFIRDFVTYGIIKTNLGIVKSDLNMKLPAGKLPVYSGNISTSNFNLGAFMDEPQIAALSMTGEIKGSGFAANGRNTKLNAKINFVDFNNYRYKNIVIKNGELKKNEFNGTVTMDDENANFILNGKINFNAKRPLFNFFADVKNVNLKNLNFLNSDVSFNGKFNLDFSGVTIDDFLGTAKITDASIFHNNNRLPFDSLVLSSAFIDSTKILTASSNEFNGQVKGKFNIKDLPASFQLFLNKYYPAYVRPLKKIPSNQAFEFAITTQYVEDYLHLIDTTLSGFNNSSINGRLNIQNSQLELQTGVPYFKIGKNSFSDVVLSATGTLDSLLITGEARQIQITDSFHIPLAMFTIQSHGDRSHVSVKTGTNQALSKANLNALVTTYHDGANIEFEPSDFVINSKTWSIDKGGELEFRTNSPASGKLVLRESDQEISLLTKQSTKGKWNDLFVNIKKLNLGDLSALIMPRNRLEGLLTGNFQLQDPLNNLNIQSDTIITQFLRLDNDSLGELKTIVAYDNSKKELKVNGYNTNEENFIALNGSLFFGDAEKQKESYIALQPRNFELKILERFLGDLFTEFKGTITGNISLKDPLNDISVIGKGRLKNAGLKVNFTQCSYNIEDTDIELKETEIDLNGIVLRDPITHNPVFLNGSIEHSSFKNMFFDVSVSTRKPKTKNIANNKPVQLLNTRYKDNQQFYGTVKGTGSFVLTGSESEMIMQINGTASETDSSTITIPPSKSRESGIADFLVERKFGQEMNAGQLGNRTSNIIYDVDITANPKLTVKVQLDDLTGDEIKGRGRGSLNIHAGTNDPLRMRGRFNVEEGNYTFTFQSVFPKPFELRKGVNSSNYIEWTGDPYAAKIHLDAIYKAEKVSLGPIATDEKVGKARTNVDVVASLSGELFKPIINFSLEFPQSSVALTDPGLSFFFRQLADNKSELYKQVTYLIVFGSFAPAENVASNQLGQNLDFSDIATNTLSGIFLGVINNQLNKILNKLLKNEKYIINLNTSIYNRNLIDQTSKSSLNLGSTINFSVGRSLFNDRFIITAAGGIDAPIQQSPGSISQAIRLLPDVTMEWLVNESGTIRTSFFYRENTDYLTSTSSGLGRSRRYGVNLSYKREFNTIKDIFSSKKKKQEPAPATDSLPTPADVPKEDEKANGLP